LVYSSTLKINAVPSSETSVNFYRTTWRYVPEYVILHISKFIIINLPGSKGRPAREAENLIAIYEPIA
jgi:hypothetical protein